VKELLESGKVSAGGADVLRRHRGADDEAVILGLTFLLISVQTGHAGWLRDRKLLYHAIH
jgi:hypothetical protein